MNYDYILWDWNGTIIDDRQLCLDILNYMLVEHGVKPVTMAQYQGFFGFPVIDYYRKAGFDFSRYSYDSLAQEFIELYQKRSLKVGLVKDSLETIKELHKRGYKQIVFSASEINNLNEQIDSYQLRGYFKETLGISNIHAKSKLDLGLNWLDGFKNKKPRLLMIGDSIHDYEVAQALGADCVLISMGSHQSIKRLEETGAQVFASAKQILTFLT